MPPDGTKNLTPAGRRVRQARDEHGLLPKERLFVDEYLLDLNATAAAIRAGYSVKTASAIASLLMKRPRIRQYVTKAKAERLKRLRLAQDEVVKELRLLVFSNLDHYRLTTAGRIVLSEDAADHNGKPVAPEVIRAVSKVKRKITTMVDEDGVETTTQESEIAVYDKNQAIRTYMAHLGIDGRLLGKDGESEDDDKTLVFKEEHEGLRGESAEEDDGDDL